MEQMTDIQKKLAEIDRMRDEIRTMEEQIGQLGDRVDKCGGNDDAYRQIGEWDRHAAELRQPLTKLIAEVRASDPAAFGAWVERNRETLRQQILMILATARPEAKTIEDAVMQITLDAKFSNDDLTVLRLAGYLDEWRDVLTGTRPFALHPPSWETKPKVS
ncbi:MAG TPA: hypothetical protein PKO06_11510 [Candidatus Ozemobacteraceae bacterium]|nr:hypothetical protein [Candidatus Ozemobacteraceae bacterium]